MDEREFDDFYTASFQRITGQVYAMIGNRDEAQECVQEAFVRAWAYRLAVSRWRRTTRGRRPADRAVGAPTQAAPPSETHVALVAALKQLPAPQRQALVLHHIADLSVHDVAREVGVPEGTIKARLSRGRAALAALLADDSGYQEGASHA